MLCTNLEQLQRARHGGYAIPAINTQGGNYDIIMAICKAAEAMRSPVILAHYVATGAYSGHDWFVQVCKWCASKVDVPVSIHLDHGDGFDICMEALRLGFTSVMIDGSTKPVAENAKLTQSVVEVARRFHVPVEAEIGELQRLDNGVMLENKNVADPEQVKEFLSLCSPDTLAIGIGNAHGYYTGKPDIRLDVLEEVRKFCDLPLVLHGCTGMDEDIIRKAVKELGIAKINFGTEIRWKYIEHLKSGLEMDHQGHSWKVYQHACNALMEDVKHIITLSGSEGKA